jgi:hypothetical protein
MIEYQYVNLKIYELKFILTTLALNALNIEKSLLKLLVSPKARGKRIPLHRDEFDGCLNRLHHEQGYTESDDITMRTN